MKYTAPKLHKLWLKEKISEGLIFPPCSDGSYITGSCTNGSNPDLACSTGTTAFTGCTTGNSDGFSCGPGYGGA